MNSRIHHFLPECITFNQSALRHFLPEYIAPRTTQDVKPSFGVDRPLALRGHVTNASQKQ